MLRHLRPFLPAASLLALSLALTACDNNSAEQNPPVDPEPTAGGTAAAPTPEAKPFAGKTLNIFMWSEYIPEEIPQQFEQLTGATVRIDTYEDSQSMSTKMQEQHAQYDLIVASDYMVPELSELKLIQPLDRAKVPNAKNVMERFAKPPYDPEGTWSLPYQWGTVGIMYRKDAVPSVTGPQDVSWALVFDAAQQPGPFLLIDETRDAFAAALKFQGHSINSKDPAVIRAAGQLLLAAKGSEKCLGFAGGGSAGPQQVASQGAALAIVYSGDAFKAMSEDETGSLAYAVPKEGGEIWTDAMMITAGAEDAELAYRFIDYVLDPQIGAQLSNWNQYGTPNQASLQYIEPEQRANPAIYPPEELMAKLEALEDVGEEATKVYEEVWTAVKAQ